MSLSSGSRRRRVVVTGAGIVSPLGVGRSLFHARLLEGVSGVGPIRLFDARQFPCRLAAQVPGSLDLDRANRWLPDGVTALDRKAGFALLAADQALEEAGLDDGCPAERRGIAFGVGVEIFRMEDIVPHGDARGAIDAAALEAALEGVGAEAGFRIPADLGPRAIRRRGNLAGRCRVNVGACVASAQAIGEGFRMIQRDRADRVVAGGADSMINPLAVAGFGLLSATSPSNDRGPAASRPFDRRRDGFVLGEGAAALVLEERAHAVARGARILAEIVGYGTSLDAYKITDPAEDGAGAAMSMSRALNDAGIRPEDVSAINAHGTSTIKNDIVETKAIRAVFGDHAPHVPISSTKSMMGHCIAAAGAMEAVACLLPFEHGRIHPTLNLEEPGPGCDLDYVPGAARPVEGRYVLSNSFGFGGQNATLILAGPEVRGS